MNVFVTFLKLLKVKHTGYFSEQYFNEHPHKYNLHGLSSMLSDYGIENAGLRIDDKKYNLPLLTTPFIIYPSFPFFISSLYHKRLSSIKKVLHQQTVRFQGVEI